MQGRVCLVCSAARRGLGEKPPMVPLFALIGLYNACIFYLMDCQWLENPTKTEDLLEH
jgi:hypothetical protein